MFDVAPFFLVEFGIGNHKHTNLGIVDIRVDCQRKFYILEKPIYHLTKIKMI
jgi:hypothetical protein